MPSPLEIETDVLDGASVEHLGDTFTYTPAGGQPVTGVNGFVDLGEDNANPDPRGAGAIAQVIVIELSADLFPVRPSDTCRITNIAGYAGKLWKPIGVVRSDKGFWRFSIQKVAT